MPKNPQEGDEYVVVDPIGGATFITYVYFMGTWQFLKRE